MFHQECAQIALGASAWVKQKGCEKAGKVWAYTGAVRSYACTWPATTLTIVKRLFGACSAHAKLSIQKTTSIYSLVLARRPAGDEASHMKRINSQNRLPLNVRKAIATSLCIHNCLNSQFHTPTSTEPAFAGDRQLGLQRSELRSFTAIVPLGHVVQCLPKPLKCIQPLYVMHYH